MVRAKNVLSSSPIQKKPSHLSNTKLAKVGGGIYGEDLELKAQVD